MAKAVFNSEYKAVLDTLLLHLPNVTPGKMFGHPACYANGKTFGSALVQFPV
jgi:hypothetical protein